MYRFYSLYGVAVSQSVSQSPDIEYVVHLYVCTCMLFIPSKIQVFTVSGGRNCHLSDTTLSPISLQSEE